MKNKKYLLVIILLTLSQLTLASGQTFDPQYDVLKDDDPAHDEEHEHEEHEALEKRLATLKNAPKYSCHVIQAFSQCREYPINETLQHKLEGLKKSCESLPEASFKKGSCPKAHKVAQCQSIQMDYHDPQTLIYDNHYYSIGARPWQKADLNRICLGLEGLLVIN